MNINYEISGGKLKASTLKDMLKNSYKDKKTMNKNIKDYELDNSLSGSRVQVYHNKNNNHTVIAHRGTKGLNDWYTNLQLSLGYKNNKRFQHSKDISDKAHQKYNDSTFTQIGHSLASEIAKKTANDNNEKDEVIKYNGPVLPIDLVRKHKDNEYDIRTSLDPISVLKPLSPFNKNTITIPSDNINPLDQHRVDKLDYLGDQEIGS